MKKLRTLYVSIPDPSVLPKDLAVEKLTKYKIQTGNVWRWSEHKGSRTLELKLGSTSDVLRKECIQSILDKIDDLLLDELDETEQSICAFSQKGFPQLKHLQVRNSPSIRYILKPPSSLAFNNISTESFSSLRVVRVESCDKMQALFPRSVMRELRQLEEIEVQGCNLMRGIVEADDDHGKFELPRLRVLELCDLRIIENFVIARSSPSSSTPDDQVGTRIAFFNGQQLRKLSISDCKKMEAIVMEEEELGVETLETPAFPMLTDLHLAELESLTCFSRKKCSREGRSQDGVQSYSSVLFNREVAFPSLEILEVNGSHNLKYMFFPSMVKSLTQLRELDVWNCEKMEAIIMEEEGSGVGISETPAFPMLTDLRLAELESLTCFSREKCSREGQSQDGVQSHSSAFFNRAVAFPNLQELKLDLSKRVWHGNFHDEESLCKLRVLELRHLSKECAISTCCFVESLTNLEELLVSESYLEDPTNNVEAIDRQCRELKVILPFSRRMQHLKTLDVSGSHGLSSMFTPTIAENLVALTKLRISNCRILTEVVSDEEFEEEQVVAFNQLKYMELEGLIELRCFSSSGYTLVFPLLEDVIVNKCPNMEFFSKGLIEAPKLERVKVDLKERYGPTTYQYFWKGNLNITIQNMCEEMASVAGLSFMQLFEFPELIEKWHCDLNPLKSSWQLKTLVVDKCPSFINAMPSKLMLVLEKMTSLQVRDCESLEEIFDLKGHEAVESTQVLPSLRNLSLINLPKLRQLWNKDLQGAMRFGSLSFLTLYKCSNLRYAFTPPMALCLANLQFMKIRECDQMEAVIEEEEGQGSMMEKITFLKLFSMELQCLPNLTSFLLGKDHVLDCPKINYLTIAHCPKMRSLTWQSSMDIDHSTPSLFTPQVQFPGLERMVLSHMDNLSKIWSNNPLETLTFDSLEKVEVQNCERLENLFPHWVTTSLTKLEKLQVESCRIEEIVANGDGTPHSDIAQVPFPKLTSLVLHDMPQLKTFCPNLPTLNWPFLKKWRVTHCDKVNMLSFAAYMNKRTQRDDQQDLSEQEAYSSFERDFPKLKRRLLDDKDIRMIRDGKYPDDIFGKPKALTLACFHEENAVFPSKFLLERFQTLESLEVFCSSFEDIFPDEGFVDKGKHPMLENLRELKLCKLHKLKRVWREDFLVSKVLQSIETLRVWDCPGLTTLFPAVTSFQNLKWLVVKDSSGLVHLGTASAIASLMHLTSMEIIGCERMEEVVASDDNREGKVISFGKLEFLVLQDMPILKCFSSTTSCILRFPSLYHIKVEECPQMKIFSKGTLNTPHLLDAKLFKYSYESKDWKECWGNDLNRAIRELSA